MLKPLLEQLFALEQRLLIRVIADREAGTLAIQKQIAECSDKQVIWFGSQAFSDQSQYGDNQFTDAKIKQFQGLLGQESDIVVFDCYGGFSPDALGALTGTVKLGGVCVLLTPPDNEWLKYLDPEHSRLCVEPFQKQQITHHFIEHAISKLRANQHCLQLNLEDLTSKGLEKFSQLVIAAGEVTNIPKVQGHYAAYSKEQALAVQSLFSFYHAKGRIAVIEADRGRGKSATMGLLSAELILSAKQKAQTIRIIVTAPKPEAARKIFTHCQQTLSENGVNVLDGKSSFIIEDYAEVKFVAPDAIADVIEDADIVLVDEAAAIPISMLTAVIEGAQKVVFATTIHGYEGTGRGFEYKFKPLLRQFDSNFLNLKLSEPIRWRRNDALEFSIQQLLLTHCELPDVGSIDTKSTQIKFWSPKELIQTTDKLESLFALLVHAHYRTSPQDLRSLLDGPNIQLVSLEANGISVGAALIATEGHIDEALCEQIWQGRRRPKGHLLPQSLISHSGFKQAGQFRYARVVRIAVHPELQNLGLGSQFLSKLCAVYQQQEFDFICTSFGLTPALFNFWKKRHFVPVRLGLKPEASSGEVSLMMVKPLTDAAKVFGQMLQERFQQTFAIESKHLARSAFEYLQPNLVDLNLNIEKQDELDLDTFVNHFRGVNTCLLALHKFVCADRQNASELLIAKFLQAKDEQSLIQEFKLSGEKQLVTKLRQDAAHLIRG